MRWRCYGRLGLGWRGGGRCNCEGGLGGGFVGVGVAVGVAVVVALGVVLAVVGGCGGDGGGGGGGLVQSLADHDDKSGDGRAAEWMSKSMWLVFRRFDPSRRR